MLTPVTDSVSVAPPTTRRPIDALSPPDGVDASDVIRSLELEELRDTAPGVPPEKLRRIAAVREQLRRGTYVTSQRLDVALRRALASLL